MNTRRGALRYWKYLTYPNGRAHLYENCHQIKAKGLTAYEASEDETYSGLELCWTCAERVAREAGHAKV
jgi:hypothetical protein